MSAGSKQVSNAGSAFTVTLLRLAGAPNVLAVLPYERPPVSMRWDVADPGLTSAFVYKHTVSMAWSRLSCDEI